MVWQRRSESNKQEEKTKENTSKTLRKFQRSQIYSMKNSELFKGKIKKFKSLTIY